MNITAYQIEIFVGNFYDKVSRDNLLGPIFNEVAEVNWDEHIPKLIQFWCSVLLKAGEYHGNAYQKHVDLTKQVSIEALHFERWLSIFQTQAKLDFDKESAEIVISKALNIADSLRFGMLKN
tara:strand:+ start:794 stop:1159 length:366 start_codon:yes stop_codon:yes gene_type:complete